MVGRLIRNRAAVGTIGLVLIVALIGIFAPFIAPNDPYANLPDSASSIHLVPIIWDGVFCRE